jgi:hypothetical protein
MANGLKLNPEKSQVILIHRCRADIPPPTLLIGANAVKVFPRVRNIGFVLNERLTATERIIFIINNDLQPFWFSSKIHHHESNAKLKL